MPGSACSSPRIAALLLIVVVCGTVCGPVASLLPGSGAILAAKAFTAVVLTSGFLPDRETTAQFSAVTIPSAITKFYPLPEEELLTAYNRGNAYLSEGRFEEALNEFNRAADLDATKGDIFLSRGIAEEKLFKWEAAVADYQLANKCYRASSFPFPRDDPTAISNLANAETGLLRWEEAYRDFAKAASMNADFLAPQIGKALVAYELGRPAETLAFFESLAGKYPTYADANAVLATLYFEGGRVDDAQARWDTAMQEDSRYKDIDWVLNIRRWPPKLVKTLENGLGLSDIPGRPTGGGLGDASSTVEPTR